MMPILRLLWSSPTRALASLIVAGTALRLLMAAALGLGIDESYMVAAGRIFRLGYFDHPPISWWLSAGISRLTGSDAAWVVRSPFILLFAGSTWLMYRLGAAISGAWAGVWAAVLLNLSPVFGVTTGGWVLPDGPLDCALLAGALCLLRALPDGRAAWAWWGGAGASAGFALLSKYSAVLILAGACVYLLTQPQHRRWLRRPHPYVAAFIAALLFTPVLVWNATHGWASFAFQGGRTAVDGLRLSGLARVLAGEALFVLPWLWLPMLVVVVRDARNGPREWRSWLLCCLGAGPVILFAVVGLWSRHVLFHWAAPGYLMWFPLLGAETERRLALWPKTIRAMLVGTALMLCAALAILMTELRWNWLAAFAGTHLPSANSELQALDWTPLREALAARGLLQRPGTVFGTLGWQDTGKVSYALGVPVICLHKDAREFGLLPGPSTYVGQDVLIVATHPVDPTALAEQGYGFDAITELPPVSFGHERRPDLQLRLFLGRKLAVRPR